MTTNITDNLKTCKEQILGNHVFQNTVASTLGIMDGVYNGLEFILAYATWYRQFTENERNNGRYHDRISSKYWPMFNYHLDGGQARNLAEAHSSMAIFSGIVTGFVTTMVLYPLAVLTNVASLAYEKIKSRTVDKS